MSLPPPLVAAGALLAGRRPDPDPGRPGGDRVAVATENKHATRGNWRMVVVKNEPANRDGHRE